MDQTPHIELRLRVFKDGGPVSPLLANTPCSTARNARAMQLKYLGLLVESGVLAGRPPVRFQQAVSHAATFANEPVGLRRACRRKK